MLNDVLQLVEFFLISLLISVILVILGGIPVLKLFLIRNIRHEKHVTVVRTHAESKVDNVGRIIRYTRYNFATTDAHTADFVSKRKLLCNNLNNTFHVILYVHVVLLDEFVNLLNEGITVCSKQLRTVFEYSTVDGFRVFLFKVLLWSDVIGCHILRKMVHVLPDVMERNLLMLQGSTHTAPELPDGGIRNPVVRLLAFCPVSFLVVSVIAVFTRLEEYAYFDAGQIFIVIAYVQALQGLPITKYEFAIAVGIRLDVICNMLLVSCYDQCVDTKTLSAVCAEGIQKLVCFFRQ